MTTANRTGVWNPCNSGIWVPARVEIIGESLNYYNLKLLEDVYHTSGPRTSYFKGVIVAWPKHHRDISLDPIKVDIPEGGDWE